MWTFDAFTTECPNCHYKNPPEPHTDGPIWEEWYKIKKLHMCRRGDSLDIDSAPEIYCLNCGFVGEGEVETIIKITKRVINIDLAKKIHKEEIFGFSFPSNELVELEKPIVLL